MAMTKVQLKWLFEKMLSDIGGKANPDVHWYLNERPKTISRNRFFEAMVWAIWVAGKSRVSADSFLERARVKGFVWDYQTVASWDTQRLSQFIRNLHGWTTAPGRPRSKPIPKGAIARWNVVHNTAKSLDEYQNERAFREEFFGGKVKSASLDHSDIRRLINRDIPFIKNANAHFIIRNMGGEAIKYERWLDTFLNHYRLTKKELENYLQKAMIALGLFDIVLWAYCEKFVKKTRNFAEHFDRAFSHCRAGY
jgi:hypothetical protein